MTKKDYIRAAKMISITYKHAVPIDKQIVVELFCDFFKADNSKFDRNRFEEACNEDQKAKS